MTTPDEQPNVSVGPGAAESSIIALDDGGIYVCQEGPRDAPTLLLIHGSAASTRSWDLLVPTLTGSHRVIRIDLLGCGRSDRPTDGSYDLPSQASRVGVVLDRLGVEHAIAVGHSSGGMVATALAEQRPDLVTAFALINTGPSMDAYTAPESAAFDPSDWPDLPDEQLRQFASAGFRAGFQIPQEFIAELRRMSLQTVAATMQAGNAYLEQRSLPDRLKVLGKPLLVIFGEDDQRWRSSSAADYQAVPDASVVLLPGVGHTPIIEDPQRTAESLLAFTAVHAAEAG